MAHFGKVFKFEKEEKLEDFLKATGIPEDKVAEIHKIQPTLKWEKDGDSYNITMSTPKKTKSLKFTPGQEVDEDIFGLPVKISSQVDGNTLTHTIKLKDKTAILKREFSADKLKTTITSDSWNGTAYTYHVAE